MASRGSQANRVTYNVLIRAQVLAGDRIGRWACKPAARGECPPELGHLLHAAELLTVHSHYADAALVDLIDELPERIDVVLLVDHQGVHPYKAPRPAL